MNKYKPRPFPNSKKKNFQYDPIHIEVFSMLPILVDPTQEDLEKDNETKFGLVIQNEFVSYFDNIVPKEFQKLVLNESEAVALLVYIVKRFVWSDRPNFQVVSKLLLTAYKMRKNIYVGRLSISTLDQKIQDAFEYQIQKNLDYQE